MAEEAEPARVTHTINLDFLRNIGMRGVNRAAGFLGLAFRHPGEPLPTTISMSNFNNYQFLPEPLEPALAGELVSEFNAWLVGNALLELDRHFSLFVDDVWRVLDHTELHETALTEPFKLSDISHYTSASTKYGKIAERLEVADPRVDRMWSITNARNCLAHAAGRVTPRHAGSEGRLKIMWLALQPELHQDGKVVVMDKPVRAPDPSKEAQVVMAIVQRERFFDVGEVIDLTPLELHELCLHYVIVIDTVMSALMDRFKAKGIPTVPLEGGVE